MHFWFKTRIFSAAWYSFVYCNSILPFAICFLFVSSSIGKISGKSASIFQESTIVLGSPEINFFAFRISITFCRAWSEIIFLVIQLFEPFRWPFRASSISEKNVILIGCTGALSSALLARLDFGAIETVLKVMSACSYSSGRSFVVSSHILCKLYMSNFFTTWWR